MWQKCPICNSEGIVPTTGNISYSSKTCDTCGGKKIISELTGLPPASRPFNDVCGTTSIQSAGGTSWDIQPLPDEVNKETLIQYNSEGKPIKEILGINIFDCQTQKVVEDVDIKTLFDKISEYYKESGLTILVGTRNKCRYCEQQVEKGYETYIKHFNNNCIPAEPLNDVLIRRLGKEVGENLISIYGDDTYTMWNHPDFQKLIDDAFGKDREPTKVYQV